MPRPATCTVPRCRWCACILYGGEYCDAVCRQLASEAREREARATQKILAACGGPEEEHQHAGSTEHR
jgi:hypothetical protein